MHITVEQGNLFMRFTHNGPNIPDQLLEKRDQGRVVFLCGAGVSINAGMPTFYDLTKHVIDYYDPAKGSAIDLEFHPWVEDRKNNQNRPKTALDQIFHLLNQEYGRENVNSQVARRLSKEAAPDVSKEHSIIARISTNEDGLPQIVTTNFDRLFETAVEFKESDIYEPPKFPHIDLGLPITGITYLHGRIKSPQASHHPYVLSSADFGRAYLSEAWATNFIRSLLERYTVVLVGYQAEDPPVKYLLQGLNHDGQSDRSNLYAFDRGDLESIEAKWRDRGVTAIGCESHKSLWETLEAWAVRADNLRQWRNSVIDLALKGPRALEPHERGQVVHLVKSTPGARLFAKADPSPSPEWLCVFDARCRLADSESGNWELGEDESYDPLEEYGLDDDPERPFKTNLFPNNILGWQYGDKNPADFHQLADLQYGNYTPIPRRLEHLTDWIIKHLNNPTTAWWASKKNGLHSTILKCIELELARNGSLHEIARRTWSLIHYYQSDGRNFSGDMRWRLLQARIKEEGWTSSVVREFTSAAEPMLSVDKSYGLDAVKPPISEWENNKRLIHWQVKFPETYSKYLNFGVEHLELVFKILEASLQRSADLKRECDAITLDEPTCYSDREVEGHNHEDNEFFRWFLELFSQMVKSYPNVLKGYVFTWRSHERYFFTKIKLFALNHPELFNSNEVAEIILNLSQEAFWDWSNKRELLFLLNDRWDEFDLSDRNTIVERLFLGPDNNEDWSQEEFTNNKIDTSCRYIKWLVLQGREFNSEDITQLDDMISSLPKWYDEWALNLLTQNNPRVRSIHTDESPEELIDVPISEVIEVAESISKRDHFSNYNKQPFDGLVKEKPRKALSVLSGQAKLGEFPEEYWRSLIRNWPENTNSRLFRTLLYRLCHLPYSVIQKLHHAVGGWLKDKLLLMYQFDEILAWKVFDHFVEGLTSGDDSVTDSGIHVFQKPGEIEYSRRTYNYAINAPIGDVTRALHSTLNSLKLQESSGIPEAFKIRYKSLLEAPGEGSSHAVILITRQIEWLYNIDPVWVKKNILPWFVLNHSNAEPAWNGFLCSQYLPNEELLVLLKPLLLELFPVIYSWKWQEDIIQVATRLIIDLAVRYKDKIGLSSNEARACLRNMNNRGRRDAALFLGGVGNEKDFGWIDYVIPFINNVWPKEIEFRTSGLTQSWISILKDTGDSFPNVLSSVYEFLVPIEIDVHWLYSFVHLDKPKKILEKYPRDALKLIDAVIPNSTVNLPYDLMRVLNLIEEADPSIVNHGRYLRLIDLIESS
ncbi:SIR2 family protein [Sessilibacter corallicola]|uniref:SIR2 family protein n=1 Tax=Sessilibacter corallicola TaxID=2904075 RepID=UPI001E4E5E95|nr:SIR2 family protein [Sessilibacter corallicola]MCE2027307.1 SIR2 family protein [Sessilibacter corallicola]